MQNLIKKKDPSLPRDDVFLAVQVVVFNCCKNDSVAKDSYECPYVIVCTQVVLCKSSSIHLLLPGYELKIDEMCI